MPGFICVNCISDALLDQAFCIPSRTHSHGILISINVLPGHCVFYYSLFRPNQGETYTVGVLVPFGTNVERF